MSRNLAASIKARLLNLARAQGTDYNRLLLKYVQERYLARLSASSYRERFVLKGGLYLYAHYGEAARPTRDLDLLGRAVSADVETVAGLVREIATIELADGVRFAPKSVRAARIMERIEHAGVRVKLTGFLETTRQIIQIDVGFGDAPTPQELEYPTLLELEGESAPWVLAYSMETVVAEKFEAMVTLGVVNGRAKDFYDIYRASHSERFEAETLVGTIAITFQGRGTTLERAQDVFTAVFANDPTLQAVWAAFLRGNPQLEAPSRFEVVMGRIRDLLEPVVMGAAAGTWQPERRVWGDGS